MNPEGGVGGRGGAGGGGTMLRVLGAAQKREVKATQNLSIIVLFFMICWIPLYTINCINAFCHDCRIHPTVTDFCIILSHLNSAVNPLLYAYHLRDFRAALKSLIYNIFGIKETDPPNDTYYKPSFISQGQRKRSCLEKRPSVIHSNQPKIYVDSPIWLRQRAAESAASAASSAALPPSGEANPQAAPATPQNKPHNREMWMISEVPSLSEEREPSQDGVATISRSGPRGGLQALPDDYDEDDDVFLPAQSLAVTQYTFRDTDDYTDLPFIEGHDEQSLASDDNSDTAICKNRRDDFSSCKKMQSSYCQQIEHSLSYSPPLDTSVYLVESDCSESSKMSPSYNPVAEVNTVLINKNEQKSSPSVHSEYLSSPTKTLRMSPLKIVGDFFLSQASHKNSKRISSGEYKKRKRDALSKHSSSDIFQYLDLHGNGSTVQKYTTRENVGDYCGS